MQTLTQQLAIGWNTWDTCSVTTFVKLPEAFALRLGIKEYRNGNLMKNPLVGLMGDDDPVVTPGAHCYNGSYTKQHIAWHDIELVIETASAGDDYVILVTPLANQLKPCSLIVESAMLWNRPGMLCRENNVLTATCPESAIKVFSTASHEDDCWADCATPFLMLSTAGPVGVSTGISRDLDEIRQVIEGQRQRWEAQKSAYGDCAETYAAMQGCMAWDTVYDPVNDRVITPVSRIWSRCGGGYQMFCWDTYFGAFMASLDNKELAFSNAIAITHDRVAEGFVPNCAHAAFASKDRSQPPVGSMMCLEIYSRYPEYWFLEEVYEGLLGWNRWWVENRMTDGLLCWGSNPYKPTVGNYWESEGVNDRFGAALESGLDNSPMYDDIPFDKETHQLKLQDVGLTGLYIGDCAALAEIAQILGRQDEADEVGQRGLKVCEAMQALWDDEFGLFLNRRTDTGTFSKRISPTNFYALIGNAATDEQAERMINDHFYNPDEFWGDWIMPSISRNDPAYPDQSYWRGRIWAPMNFLVYLGLRNYDLPEARKDLAVRSNTLILKEWLEHGHVHENYCADTGEGCNKGNSDRFYHWGGLLAAIHLMEKGYW